MILTLDGETPTKNKGHPFTPGNKLVSFSIKEDDGSVSFHYYTDPDFITVLRGAVNRADEIVGLNVKFDLHHVGNFGIEIPLDVKIFDCSLAEFILTGQEAVMVSLDEALGSYGLASKDDAVATYWAQGIDTIDIPYEVLEKYNNRDVEQTYQLYLIQKSLLNEKQLALVYLEGEDMKTLMEAERAGLKLDKKKADEALKEYKDSIDAGKQVLWSYVPEEARQWFNWNSGDDVSALLYGGVRTYPFCTEEEAIYKSGNKKGTPYIKRYWFEKEVVFPKRFNPLEGTMLKKCQAEGYTGPLYYQIDDPTLKQLKTRKKEDKELLDSLFKQAKTSKIIETIESFLKLLETYEWEDNLVHGQYNQNVARSGRLSSSKPNLQNTDEIMDALLISRY